MAPITSDVGGSDPLLTGYAQLELIRLFCKLRGASIVDIGCGIGRLTRHLVHEQIAEYVGIDVVPEIMRQASDITAGDPRFRFEIADDFKIPKKDGTATLVVAFSVITHLLDEEGFDYVQEARRVLKPGGVALFSFLDFVSDGHLESFFQHASQYRHSEGDLLKFTTKGVLEKFARRAGFTRAEFIDGSTPLRISRTPSKLFDVKTHPDTHALGQSICAMTV